MGRSSKKNSAGGERARSWAAFSMQVNAKFDRARNFALGRWFMLGPNYNPQVRPQHSPGEKRKRKEEGRSAESGCLVNFSAYFLRPATQKKRLIELVLFTTTLPEVLIRLRDVTRTAGHDKEYSTRGRGRGNWKRGKGSTWRSTQYHRSQIVGLTDAKQNRTEMCDDEKAHCALNELDL